MIAILTEYTNIKDESFTAAWSRFAVDPNGEVNAVTA